MKRIFLIAAVTMGLGCALSSCEKDSVRADGDWDPIIVDKSEITMPLAGSKDSVCITKNYNSWWICDLKKNGEYIYNELSDTIICDGLTAIVPKDRKNFVIISVSPSETANNYVLTMQCGDAFRPIHIKQE